MATTSHLAGHLTPARRIAAVLAGSLIIALAAQVSVPFYPVPMTLQTMAILGVGFALGSRLGAATVLVYLGQGAMGLPVFANGMNGIAFFGPTAGFLIGFVGLAWLAGLATDRGTTHPVKLAIVAMAASLALYVPGLAWPLGLAQIAGIEAGWAGLNLGQVVSGFAAPFLLGDMVKAIVAALLASGGFAAFRRA